MTARPILFSGAMVRALLAGTKTQTRRVVKGVPLDWLDDFRPEFVASPANGLCPYGYPGDQLYVRETLKRAPDLWTYPADGAEVGWPARGDLAGKTRDTIVSIHMPRAASRLTLAITDVRIERLQDCSEDDARAEGASECANGWWFDGSPSLAGSDALGAYYCLWSAINGPDSWAANPWVWVVSFRVEHRNVDAPLQIEGPAR